MGIPEARRIMQTVSHSTSSSRYWRRPPAPREAFGRLDAVVANAGFATHDDIADGDPAGWREMVLTNTVVVRPVGQPV
jgi:NAD(P)-dependent dehydrogenase (short-subunit alcohol dehydrogenase family)